MSFVPIQKQRVYRMIIEQIKESIEKGTLKPGDRLPSERDMAELLSVSRGAVREAFSVLEASRMVHIQPGVGIFLETNKDSELIHKLDELISSKHADARLIHLLEVRQAIESQAAYLAAVRRTGRDIEIIRRAYDRLAASVRTGQVAAKEDYQFHAVIVDAANNPLLSEAVRLFSDSCLESLYVTRSESIRDPGKSMAVLEEHRQIMLAIESGDKEEAQTAMWQHLNNVKMRYAIQ